MYAVVEMKWQLFNMCDLVAKLRSSALLTGKRLSHLNI